MAECVIGESTPEFKCGLQVAGGTTVCFVWPTYQTPDKPDVRENAKTVVIVTVTEHAAVAREENRKEYQIDKEWRA
jgi:hypothetical protein